MAETDRFSVLNAAFNQTGRFPKFGTTAGDANAASPEPLGSLAGTAPGLPLWEPRERADRSKFLELRLKLKAVCSARQETVLWRGKVRRAAGILDSILPHWRRFHIPQLVRCNRTTTQ